jgi:hypothetical protein
VSLPAGIFAALIYATLLALVIFGVAMKHKAGHG